MAENDCELVGVGASAGGVEALNGDEPSEPLVDEATNRYGRQIEVRVRVSPLSNHGSPPRGLIVFMEPVDT